MSCVYMFMDFKKLMLVLLCIVVYASGLEIAGDFMYKLVDSNNYCWKTEVLKHYCAFLNSEQCLHGLRVVHFYITSSDFI